MIVLERTTQDFATAAAAPPLLYERGYDGARKVLDDIQAAPIAKPDVDETWITVPAAVGDVRVRIVKPVGTVGQLPAVLYIHGGGWVLGNAGTHDRLVSRRHTSATPIAISRTASALIGHRAGRSRPARAGRARRGRRAGTPPRR